MLEQRIAPDDAAVPAKQEVREIELALRELDVASVDADAPPLHVDAVRSKVELAFVGSVRAVAAQERADAREQLAALGGLHDVIVAAARERTHEIFFGIARREEDHRQAAIARGADPTEHI